MAGNLVPEIVIHTSSIVIWKPDGPLAISLDLSDWRTPSNLPSGLEADQIRWVQTQEELPELQEKTVQSSLVSWYHLIPLRAHEPEVGEVSTLLFDLSEPQFWQLADQHGKRFKHHFSYRTMAIKKELSNQNEQQNEVEKSTEPGENNSLEESSERILVQLDHLNYYQCLTWLEKGKNQRYNIYYSNSKQIWQQLGWRHPFSDKLKPYRDQLLLIQQPRRWEYLQDGQWTNIPIKIDPIPGLLNQNIDNAIQEKTREISEQKSAAFPGIHLTWKLIPQTTMTRARFWLIEHFQEHALQELFQNNSPSFFEELQIAKVDCLGQKIGILKAKNNHKIEEVLLANFQAYYVLSPQLSLVLPCNWGWPCRMDPSFLKQSFQLKEEEWVFIKSQFDFNDSKNETYILRIANKLFRPMIEIIQFKTEQIEPVQPVNLSPLYPFPEFQITANPIIDPRNKKGGKEEKLRAGLASKNSSNKRKASVNATYEEETDRRTGPIRYIFQRINQFLFGWIYSSWEKLKLKTPEEENVSMAIVSPQGELGRHFLIPESV